MSDLYVDDAVHELEIGDTVVKIQELTGEEFTGLLESHDVDDPDDIGPKEYARMLIPACVIEPSDLEVGKLKADVYSRIVDKIDDVHGMTELQREGFRER